MKNSEQQQEEKRTVAFTSECAIHNNDKVTNTLMLFIQRILQHRLFEEVTVFGIIFEEEKPVDKNGVAQFGGFYPLCKTFVVNLMAHWTDTLKEVVKPSCNMRADQILWFNLLITIIHELKHCSDLRECSDNIAKFEALEDHAQDWAYEALFQLAADGIDIEMPDMLDDPTFGEPMTSLYEEIMTGGEDWHKIQEGLINDGLILRAENVKFSTFRDYLKATDPQAERIWVEVLDQVEDCLEETASCEGAAISDLAEVATNAENIQIIPKAAMPAPGAEVVLDHPITPEPTTLVTEVPVVAGDAPADVIEEPIQPSNTEQAGDDMPEFLNPNEAPPAPAAAAASPAAAVVASPIGGTAAPGPVAAKTVQTAATNPALTVEPSTLSVPEQLAVMDQVYYRLYMNMFNKCGFQINSDRGFTSPMAILEPIFIGDIPGVEQLVISYDSYNAMGQVENHLPLYNKVADGRESIPDGHIKGSLTKNNEAPAYIIYVNVGGKLQKRSLRPQNCNKMKGDVLSAWAKDARDGICIGLVYKDVTPAEQQAGESIMYAKIITNPGQKTVITYKPFNDLLKWEVVV